MLVFFFACICIPAAHLAAGETEDRSLASRIQDALRSDPAMNNLFMQVTAVDGRVTLNGRAVSPDNKELAERIARRVKGVRSVENALDIKPLDKDDIETLNAMKQKASMGQQFSRRPLLQSPAEDPQYFLDKNNYYKNLDKMSSHLDRNIYENYSDRDIKIRVEEAISSAPTNGRTDNITVLVSNGRVTLLGTVDSIIDQQTVVDVASRVPGVKSVDNSTNLNR
jgi:osmotically-inducible protein OsmY